MVLFAFSSVTASFADYQAQSQDDVLDSSPSSSFISICDDFFNDVEHGSAIDKRQVDITEEFYNTYLDSYLDGDYTTIRNACAGLTEFAYTEEIDLVSPNSLNAVVSKSVEKRAYVLETCQTLIPGKKFEFSYYVRGNYRYNPEENIITSCDYTGECGLLALNGGSRFDGTMVNKSCVGTVSDVGDYVIYRCSFRIFFMMFADDDHIAFLDSETTGPYSDSVVGYPG